MSVESLAQALLEAGILDASTVGEKASRARDGRQLLDGLVADGDVSESGLVNQLARALSVPRYDPRERQPEPEAVALVDPRTAEELGVLPVAVRGAGGLLWVAMCDPTDDAILAEVSRRTGRRVKACLIGPRELAKALQQAQGKGGAYAAIQPPPVQTYRAPAAPAPPPPTPVHATGSTGYAPATLASNGMPGGYAFPHGAPMAGTTLVQPGPVASGGKSTDLQRLEDELSQAKQVVKVLVQLLVERGLMDGEEFKRRLRAERERR